MLGWDTPEPLQRTQGPAPVMGAGLLKVDCRLLGLAQACWSVLLLALQHRLMYSLMLLAYLLAGWNHLGSRRRKTLPGDGLG